MVSPFYTATLWVIASPSYTPRFFFNKAEQYHSCPQKFRFLWDPHPYTDTPPPAPSHITILHLLAATTDGPPQGFPSQEYQVDRDRRYDDVSSCRRAYEKKECGDNGCRGPRLLEEAISRGGIVWYFGSCNQNVQGDAKLLPLHIGHVSP